MTSERPAPTPDPLPEDDPRYRRAARLLAQKLGVHWRALPPEQIRDYARKIEIARAAPETRRDTE